MRDVPSYPLVIPSRRIRRITRPTAWGTLLVLLILIAGCHTLARQADRDVAELIRIRQQAVLDDQQPPNVTVPEEPPLPTSEAYEAAPEQPRTEVPDDFVRRSTGDDPTLDVPAYMATTQPSPAPETPPVPTLTLTDALAYAQVHRRQYQSAKEDLYLAALALTLERHLWTPIFASNFRTVYGNYGEAQDFDQAMRFVADLSVSQRLPYGGEATAEMISTLIRDVGKSITATEQSELAFGLRVPLLRGAGHVARETLIQLERELTYAVRTFERFRRRQLVLVAQDYFDLLRVKQQVEDSRDSLERAQYDYERALAVESTRNGNPLDTMRAEQRKLSAENTLENVRESFRSRADQFKLLIGMPVSQPLEMDDLEDIDSIERKILADEYPLLQRPPAVGDEDRAVSVALGHRLDLRNADDQIEDARRGVAISRNALLPDLEWTGEVTFDTDPEHYNMGAFHVERANWRTELVLSLPLERTAERNAYRRAMIDVRQSQRNYTDLSEQIRAQVRSAVYQLWLAERSLTIQRRNLEVATRRAEYAQIRFEDGDIPNRDKIEAETEKLNAQNALNAAKTARWNALLNFRLATGALRIDESGVQTRPPTVTTAPSDP